MEPEVMAEGRESAASSPRPLGHYLGASQAAVESALARQRAPDAPENGRRRIGHLLIEQCAISREQLEAAVRRQRIDRLAACSLFRDVGPAALSRLIDVVHEVSVPAGETFIEQDSTGDAFFIIASGRVQVYGRYEGVEESPLAVLGPGQSIGEMGYFTQGRRSASARALEPVELLALHYRELPRCFELVPELATGFLRTLTERLRELNQLYHVSTQRARASERSLKHLTDYLDLSEHLSLGTGIEALIDRVVRTASRLLGAERASLFLVDPATGDLWSKVAQGVETREIRIKKGHGLAGWVAERGQTLNIPDAYQDGRFNPETDRRTGYRTRSILCGPVHNLAGNIIGVIQVINKHDESTFTELDEQLFKAFAHQAAISVENFNLYRRLVASHEKMAILLDVATSVTQTLALPSLIRKIVAKVTEILHCERCSFFVFDREAGELWSMEAHGSELKEIRFPVSAGLAGHTARTGEVVNIDDAYRDPRFNPEIDKASGYRTRSVLCVPTLDHDGSAMGVTQAINKIGGPFAAEDVGMLKAISSQIGVAVENAQLYARTESMKRYLQSVQESISNSIFTLDETHRMVTANRAAFQLLDAAPNECLNHDVRDVLGDPNRYLLGLIDRAYEANRSLTALDMELAAKGKRSSTVNASVLPLKGPDETRQGLVVVLEDITREKRVKSLLVKKMAKDVVERMLNDPELQELGGHRSRATILFSDIRNFTHLSEAMSADRVVELLNAYFTVMVEEVQRERGVLDKFMGDSLMALFGVPYAEDDDAVRAVRAALRMREVLTSFNAGRCSRGLEPMRIGIGISTGEVVSGNIGSESRSDFTVIGDSVNVASRLESLNKHYGSMILVSEFTRQELADLFCVRLIDHVRLPGKRKPTAVFEVLGQRDYRPTPAQAAFDAGLGAYRRRAWAEALEHFHHGSGEDPPCRAFAKRCELLVRTPPAPEWDLVWDMPAK